MAKEGRMDLKSSQTTKQQAAGRSKKDENLAEQLKQQLRRIIVTMEKVKRLLQEPKQLITYVWFTTLVC
jgi:hypothetical protein